MSVCEAGKHGNLDDGLIRKKSGLSQTTSGDDAVTQAYQWALKNGKKKNNRIPVMIVGQDRSGGTSLRKRLLGLPFDPEEPRTVDISVDFVELSKSSSKKPWKPKEFKSFLTSKGELEEAICREAGTILRDSQYDELRLSEEESYQSEKTSFPNIDWDKEIQDGPVNEEGEEPFTHKKSSSDRGAPATTIDSEIDEGKLLNERPSRSQRTKILNHRDAITKKQNPPIQMIVHDLAGQSIFYDTHYLFLKPHCPYILVHDLTKPLDEMAKPRFKPVDAGIDLGIPLFATNLDYLLLWLNVLAHLGRHESDGEKTFEDFAPPPVLLALTNIDQFTGDIEEVKKRITEVIRERHFDNVFIDTIHVIGNTTAFSEHDTILQLRDRTFDFCEKILSKEQPMPLTWMNFEVALTDEAFGKRNYIPVKEAREVAEKCGVDCFEDALTYFQRQGIFVYYKECRYVVLNPVWLMNRFTEVITVPDVEDQRRPLDVPYHEKLRKRGILMKEFLERYPDGEILEDVMQRVSLMCPLQHEEKDAFLVPSVAPLMKKGESIMGDLKRRPLATLFIVFVCNFLLPGIFARLQVKLVSEFRQNLRRGSREPSFFSNCSSFPLEYGSVKFNVYLLQLIEKIKIVVILTKDDVPSENTLGAFANYLKVCLEKCLEAIKSEEHLFYRGVQYDFNVQCTACVREEHCHRHKKEKCEHDECVHLHLLSKLDRKTDSVSCEVGGVIKEFDLKRVKHWLCADAEAEKRSHSPEVDPVTKKSRRFPISVLSATVYDTLCRGLNKPNAGKDWKELAGRMGYTVNERSTFELEKSPAQALLSNWGTKTENDVEKLVSILKEMGRDDLVDMLVEPRF